ncbi:MULTISPECIES: DNA replication/repair protein RecF [unclassified Candidatus Paralachnospira]|uniref:DNA replication/repair protein RecF n=1 Tax=unclassified Candidatus Paralachnospira TaxID=3099471 RepID=UPI00304895F6
MFVKTLELKNYRNYEKLHIDFSSGTNILYGDNAQGKTNILESIYVCATSKSHRGSKDKEIIHFHDEESHIKLLVEKKGRETRIDMHLKKNKTKGIAIDGLPIRKASELFGNLNVVFFSPEDLNIIKNGPAERRRFLDMELCQLDRFYTAGLVSYNQVLNQRNKLLKELSFRPEYEDMLPVWDEQMVNYGVRVMERRRSFLKELGEIISGIHRSLTGGKEEIRVVYEPDTEPEQFAAALLESRERDKKNRVSMRGPHRDDIVFLVNGIDIRKYGSQGQQRSAALSLKLSEIEMIRRTISDPPVLLLDDVLSELDANRQNHLLESIKGIQTIITCTGLDEFVNNHFSMNQVYQVVNGRIVKEG